MVHFEKLRDSKNNIFFFVISLCWCFFVRFLLKKSVSLNILPAVIFTELSECGNQSSYLVSCALCCRWAGFHLLNDAKAGWSAYMRTTTHYKQERCFSSYHTTARNFIFPTKNFFKFNVKFSRRCISSFSANLLVLFRFFPTLFSSSLTVSFGQFPSKICVSFLQRILLLRGMILFFFTWCWKFYL